MLIASYLVAMIVFSFLGQIESVIIAQADPLTIIFGSLGGIAALVVAFNTVQIRREAKRQAAVELEKSTRMDVFEMSQASLQAALIRSDADNIKLSARIEKQETIISDLRKEVRELRAKLEACLNGK